MGIVGNSKPLVGDPMEKEHAALPAGAIEGELFVAAPTVKPTAADGGPGAIPNLSGLTWAYTFAIRNPVTDHIVGETPPSPASTEALTGTSKQGSLTSVAVSTNPHVNTRRIYRGGNLVGQILDNITTTFTDNTASTSGQPAAPTSNTTGQSLTANVRAGTANGLALKEEGTERYAVSAKGVLRRGVTSWNDLFGFSDVISSFSRAIDTTGYTVSSNEILIVTSAFGPVGTAQDVDLQIVENSITHPVLVVTQALTSITWLLHNPIVLDQTWQLKASAAGDPYHVSGLRITRHGGITPVLKEVNSAAAYTVTTGKILVILGCAALDATVDVQVEDDNSSGTYRTVVRGPSLVTSDGVTGITNRFTVPVVVSAGLRVRTSTASPGAQIWGVEIDT